MANTLGLSAVLDLSLFLPASKIFITQVGKMNAAAAQAAISIGANFEKVGGAFETLGFGGMGGILQNIGGVAGAIGDIWSTIFPESSTKRAINDSNIFGSIWDRIKTIIGGIITIDIWRTFTNGFKSLSEDALKAVDYFQRIQIQFDSLFAKDVSRTTGIPVGEALKYVTERTQELLLWIRKLAVETPFTVESLTKMIAWGKAFGFTTARSKELTIAIGNFTSAMGLEDENMERIMYHFGQMNALGKVMGRQLLGLGQDMVPVAEIIKAIADETKKSVSQVREELASGAMDPQVFIGKFLEMMNRDFPDAMNRMARTLTGVKQNIQDFIQTLFGMEFLGPVMSRVTASLYDFLQVLLSEESIRNFTAAGQTLLMVYDNIASSLETYLIPAVRNFIDNIGLGGANVYTFAEALFYVSTAIEMFIRGMSYAIDKVGEIVGQILDQFQVLIDLPYKSYGWGANVILMFAKGLAFGLRYVIQALNVIAIYITRMLRAHSPPELLPDLPLWGMQAMQSYLEGWSSADFSVFDDISGMIEKYIRSIPGMADADILSGIIGSRASVDELIDQFNATGDIGQSALMEVANATGVASEAMRDYIVNLLNMQRAQQNLNSITKYYDDILKDLNEQRAALRKEADDTGRIREIDKAMATGLLTSQEYENLSLEKRGIILDQQIEQTKIDKENAVSAAQAKLDAAKELYDVTKAYLEVQIRNNELLKEQLDLLNKLKEGKGTEEEPEISLGEGSLIRFPKGLPQIEDYIGELRKKLRGLEFEVYARFVALGVELKKIFTPLEDPFLVLVGSVGKLYDQVVLYINSPEYKELKDGLKAMAAIDYTALLAALNTMDYYLRSINYQLGTDISLWDILDMTLGTLAGMITIAIITPLAIASGILGAFNGLVRAAGELVRTLKQDFIDLKDSKGLDWFVNIFKIMADTIIGVLSFVVYFIAGFVEGVINFFKNLWYRLVGGSIIPEMLDDILDAFTGWITQELQDVGQFVTDMLNIFTSKTKEFYDAGYALIAYVSNGIWAMFFAPNTGLIAKLGVYVSSAATAVTSKLSEWSVAGANLVAGIIQGIGAQSGKLWSAIVDLVKKALGIFKKETREDSPSKETARIGENLMLGLEVGMLGRLDATKRVVMTAMDQVLGAYDSQLKYMTEPLMNYAFGSTSTRFSSVPGAVTNNYIDNSVNMQMSPHYAGYQSPATIRHDMSAAIAAIRR